MNYLLEILNLPDSNYKKMILFGLAMFFIFFGIDHLVNPEFYLSIMPPSFPLHLEAVYLSGFFEIIGGTGVLFSKFRIIAGWGLVALLVAVYPANIYMALNAEAFPNISTGLLYFRLILQFLFFYWAYTVTTQAYNKHLD